MTVPVVLDAGGLDTFVKGRRPERFDALLADAWAVGGEVLVPAVVCAEVCRGSARTRAVESALARASRRGAPPVRVIDTTFNLARQVGAVLHAARASTVDIVDAHVVAACLPSGGGIVITSDPHDIGRLAAVMPGLRIATTLPGGQPR